MIINDLQLRMGFNNQETGAGKTEFDTMRNIYSIISADAVEGYFSAMVLPAMPFNAVLIFEADVRISTGDAGLLELHTHNSAYYGSTFTVVDSQTITSDLWEHVKLRYVMTSQGGRVFPRLNMGVDDGLGTLEVRNPFLRIDYAGSIRLDEIDRKLRAKRIGPDFQTTQGITTTTTGSGTVIYDVSNQNFTEFIASGSDTAFITIDDFAGFERNINTEYYILEIDALVERQDDECVARFAFRDSVGGDKFFTCKLTQTVLNDAGATGTYQTYRFWIVQDGSPATIDSVELELGAMVGFQSSCRIREARLRSYGLTTSNLKQINTQASCTVEKQSGVWDFDNDYRRENFNDVSEFDANTLSIGIAYVSGKLMVPVPVMRNNATLLPVVSNVNASRIQIQFYLAGVLQTLASISDGTGVYIQGES